MPTEGGRVGSLGSTWPAVLPEGEEVMKVTVALGDDNIQTGYWTEGIVGG